MVSTLEQMQVPNGTGVGVRRSKRPLWLAAPVANVLWKPPEFGSKVKFGIRSSSVTRTRSSVKLIAARISSVMLRTLVA